MNIHRGALLGMFLALGAGACDDGAGAAAAELEERGVTLLAEVEQEDFVLRFTKSAGGTIAVSEDGPMDQPSYLAHLSLEEHATPMEIFLAIDPEGEVPEELRIDHEATTKAPPRALSLPQVSFRSVSQGETAATCSLTADGGWFDGEWSSRGWTYHTYHNTSAAQTDSAQKAASNFITHVCNNSVAPNVDYSFAHYLYDRSLPNNLQFLTGDTDVKQGRRNVITVSSQSGTYQAQAVVSAWAAGNYKFGVMAP
ncbi:hypothetical protein [Nannocystis punicea]|uniref:Lipoprotein n=1 Tax=Nannocystis punicea TaxID=2995304 RepID=A0ABY7GTN4_9BACT|nr:hypothetical protein [Nannocystis poenicansa]WAS90327.1 hypothetical protein O0S08_29410 [Nannocystis poenicansa]